MSAQSKAPEQKIRVMLVDDHPVMRGALRNILEAEEDIAIVAEADGGEAALNVYDRAKPDVILMDGSMPDMNGMEATRELRARDPDVKVVGLTLYEQTTYLEEMVAVGGRGYVLKTGSPADVVKAIRVVAGGGTYFSESVPRRTTAAAPEHDGDGELTSGELAVVKLVAEGHTNSEIAEALRLTKPEVQTRRSAAMKNLGLHTRAELVRLANERHWLA
jgi:two-component system response regulator NreC